jgi:hypothetical protein
MRNLLIAMAVVALSAAGHAAIRSKSNDQTASAAPASDTTAKTTTVTDKGTEKSSAPVAKATAIELATRAASSTEEAVPKSDTVAKADGVKSDATAAATQAAAAAPPAPHLMAQTKEDRLRKLLPHTDNFDLQKILHDSRLILYTEAEMPRAFQDWSGNLQGVHSAYYNISANGSEPYGNGNREFPWGTPAGTQRTKGVETFRFVWLPRDTNDKPRPIVWFRKRLRGDSNDGYAWTFPVGAIVGEALAMTGPDGYEYTFEMRVRTRQYGFWDVDVYRPFPTAADLAGRIKELRPDWKDQPKLLAAVEHLEEPLEMKTQTLADKQPAQRTFSQTMGVDTLPSLGDDKLVSQLLANSTFRNVSGKAWRESPNGVKTFAPTTSAAFHIVPANYDAGFVQVDSTSCMRCHDSVGKPVTDFNPGRDWYGHIRGSDGILSFHPFSPDCVSDNGFGRGVSMRTEFEKTGVIAKYDPTQHPAKFYQTLETVKH